MYESLGILEVTGWSSAFICIDQMVKAAFVEIDKVEKIQSGLVAIIIKGDLASVQVAIEVGCEYSSNNFSFYNSKIIARPYEGLHVLFDSKEKSDY